MACCRASATLPRDSASWQIRRSDIRRAIRLSGSSAPGPDGLPYAVWRRLGPLAETVLHEAAASLSTSGASAEMTAAYADEEFATGMGHGFNHGLLVMTPKAPAGTQADGTPLYAPSGLRPLSLVNCDNRLIASAARLRWELLLAQ